MTENTMIPFYMFLVAVVTVMINIAAAADPPVAAAEPPVTAAEPPVATPATAYINHTVGDSAGWFFNADTNKTSSDYSAWAANQSFNLGDYLIFNTDSKSTIIQTYNLTTYNSCSVDDSSDSDTFQYTTGNNSVNVPLIIEATQYYFSAAGDGLQCQNGMAFEIKVGRGLGLPPSLNQPPPPPYVAPPSTVEGGDSPPMTIIPSSTSIPNSGMKVGGCAHVLYLALMALLVLYL